MESLSNQKVSLLLEKKNLETLLLHLLGATVAEW